MLIVEVGRQSWLRRKEIQSVKCWSGSRARPRTVTKSVTFRLNGGILFAGSGTTGAEGFRTRGTVYTGGGSLTKQFTPKLLLGAELTGASNGNFNLGAALLQTTIGGNYQIRKNATLDFGIVAGKHEASPRFGALVGISIDF